MKPCVAWHWRRFPPISFDRSEMFCSDCDEVVPCSHTHDVVLMREKERLTFTEIGSRLGITGSYARQKYNVAKFDRRNAKRRTRDMESNSHPCTTNMESVP